MLDQVNENDAIQRCSMHVREGGVSTFDKLHCA